MREQADRLFALLRHALRFWSTGLIVLVLGCVLALGVALTRPRIYRSEALILYRERVAPSALGRDEAVESARRIGLRLRELVLSRSRLERIIAEFHLYGQLVEERGMAEAVDLMRTKVNFKAREGDTYALSFEGEDPALVQQVTQRLTDALVAENERSTVEVAAGTKDFLDAELQRIEEELKKRESRLAKFLSEHPAFAAAPPGTSSLAGVTMTDPKKAGVTPPPVRRAPGDPRLEALEREAERIRARLNPTAPPAQSLSPEAKEALEMWNRRKAEANRELEAAQRDLQDKAQTYTDEHPDMKRAKGRVQAAVKLLDDVQLQSMREIARLQGRSEAQIKPLTAEERDRLQGELVKVQQERDRLRSARRSGEGEREAAPAPARSSSEADNIVKLETTWVQLTREVADAQEQRRQVETKRFTAEIRDRLAQTEGGTRLVVIDPPYRPTKPARGGRGQVAMLGGVAALIFAFLVMLARALLDDRVYTALDIERLEIGPLLGVVPRPSPPRARGRGRLLAWGARPAPSERAARAGQAGADRPPAGSPGAPGEREKGPLPEGGAGGDNKKQVSHG
jgi:uncharacterized protein involved in exopolysaccharide biosynthesis